MKTTFRSIGIGFLLSALIVAGMIFATPYLPSAITKLMAQDATTTTSKEYDDLKAEFEQYKLDKEKEIEELKASKNEDQEKNATNSTPESKEDTTSNQGNTLIINPGETSYEVSTRLAEMGLIDSQADFSAFLSQNGYDVNIQPGEYQLQSGMTYNQIAQIITAN